MTNFSVVSLPFCVVIAEFVQLGHVFVPFYLRFAVHQSARCLEFHRSQNSGSILEAGKQARMRVIGEDLGPKRISWSGQITRPSARVPAERHKVRHLVRLMPPLNRDRIDRS